MGRQASAASRNAQKWQVANGKHGNEPEKDWPNEDDEGGSTRMPSSGGASPSASSAVLDALGAEATANPSKTNEQLRKEKEDRARWADVEDDGEAVIVFYGPDGKPLRREPGHKEPEGWATKSKNKGKSIKNRSTKADPGPPAWKEPPAEAPRQKQPSKQPVYSDDTPKTAFAAYREGKKQADAWPEERWETSASRWEADTWSASGRGGGGGGAAWTGGGGGGGGKRGGGGGGGGWKEEERSWKEDRSWKEEAPRAPKAKPPAPVKEKPPAPAPVPVKETMANSQGGSNFFKPMDFGGKAKNESFKRGPNVATNMESSRLNW